MSTTNQSPANPSEKSGHSATQAGTHTLGADLSTLADRLRRAETTTEEGAEFLLAHWQKFVGAVAVLLVGVWVAHQVRESGKRAVGDSGARFAAVQAEFSRLFGSEESTEGATQEVKDQAKRDQLRAFQDSLSSLNDLSTGSSSYPRLGALYGAAAEVRRGDVAAAREKLAGVKPFRPTGLSAPAPATALDEDRFVGELAGLLSLRIELTAAGALTPEIREAATQLARGAQFVNTEAVLILARFAATDEEKRAVKALADEVNGARTGQAENLTEELKRLGIR